MMGAFKDLGAQGETAARLEESLNTLMSLVKTLIILAGEYQPPRFTLMLRCITDDGWTERWPCGTASSSTGVSIGHCNDFCRSRGWRVAITLMIRYFWV